MAAGFHHPVLKILSLLHDVMEDNPREYPESVMRDLFPSWVVDHLLLLTRQQDEPYDLYILRAGSNPVTREVKIQDLRDNIRDLDGGSLRDKYRLSIRLLGSDPDQGLHEKAAIEDDSTPMAMNVTFRLEKPLLGQHYVEPGQPWPRSD